LEFIVTNDNNKEKGVIMLIKSLEEMETIVENNDSLSWNGWTVIESKANATGWMKADGAFVKGKWYTQKRYSLNEDGWTVPAKLAKKNAE
jgi:hypothetical protein